MRREAFTPAEAACFRAALEGHHAHVRAWLEKGVDAESLARQCLLNILAMRGDVTTAEVLLEAGIDPSRCYQGNSNYNALDSAAVYDQGKMLELLARYVPESDYGTSPLAEALLSACFHGKLTAVQTLLQLHAGVDYRSEEGTTPLMWACRSGNVQCVRVLLDAGADPWPINKSRMSAYRFASKFGRGAVCELLVVRCGTEIKTQSPRSPLDRLLGTIVKRLTRT